MEIEETVVADATKPKAKSTFKEIKLGKVQLSCLDKEADIYEVLDLMPDDVVVCEVEKEEIEYHKARKVNYLKPIVQTREVTGGLLSSIVFNSEGYNESLKLTIIGVKPKA